MSKENKASESSYLLFLTAVITKIIGAFFKIPLSGNSCLGDLGFGYFSAAYDLFTPISVLAISGFPVAVSHMVSEKAANKNADDIKKVFCSARRIITVISAVGAVALGICLYIAYKVSFIGKYEAYSAFCVVPSFVFCGIAAVYRGYFEGVTNMRPAAVSSLIEAVCKLLLGYSFAAVTVKLTGNVAYASAFALIGITLGTLLSAVYLVVKFKGEKLSLNHFDYSSKSAKEVLIIAVPVAVASLSGSFVALIDTLSVRYIISGYSADKMNLLTDIYRTAVAENTADLGAKFDISVFLYGIRSKAYTLFNIVPTLTVAIGVGFIPKLTEAKSEDSRSLAKNISSVLKFTAAVCLPCGVGFVALNNKITALLYSGGASSDIGGNMLVFYGFATVFAGLSVVLTCILQALSRQNIALFNVSVGIAVKIILNFWLTSIAEVNIFGSVISTVCCYAVILILNLIFVFKSIGSCAVFKVFLKPFAFAVACGLAAYGVGKLGDGSLITVAAILSAAIVYFVLIFAFRTFSDEEICEFPFGEKLCNLKNRLKLSN